MNLLKKQTHKMDCPYICSLVSRVVKMVPVSEGDKNNCLRSLCDSSAALQDFYMLVLRLSS